MPRFKLRGLGLTRWPTTPEEWARAAAATGARMREAAIEVAEEIDARDLADEMREDRQEAFPAAEYLSRLNERSPGAGNRALRRAEKRGRR